MFVRKRKCMFVCGDSTKGGEGELHVVVLGCTLLRLLRGVMGSCIIF